MYQSISEQEILAVSAWGAAIVSAISFLLGGVLPFLAILLLPASTRIGITFGIVLVALAITGALGARLGGAKAGRAALRVVVGGTIALAATYGLGTLLGSGPV